MGVRLPGGTTDARSTSATRTPARRRTFKPAPAYRLRRRPGLDGRSTGTAAGRQLPSANDWGLYDMHGNVGRVVPGLVRPGLLRARRRRTTRRGRTKGNHRVVRGGSWLVTEASCRSASRFWPEPRTSAKYYVGFRVARDAVSARRTRAADRRAYPGTAVLIVAVAVCGCNPRPPRCRAARGPATRRSTEVPGPQPRLRQLRRPPGGPRRLASATPATSPRPSTPWPRRLHLHATPTRSRRGRCRRR